MKIMGELVQVVVLCAIWATACWYFEGGLLLAMAGGAVIGFLTSGR